MAQYYAVEEWAPSGFVKAMATMKLQSQERLVVAQGSSLNFYSLGARPTHIMQESLKGHISSITVLPSRHHSSDFLLVGDSDGRWAVWSVDGLQQVDNTRMAPSNLLYQKQSSPLHSDTTVSQQCHFDVSDTVGHFLVAVPPQLSIASYVINRHGLTIDKPKRLQMPFPLVRQVAWLPKGKHLGVVVEKQEFTEWVVYDMGQECQFSQYNLKHTQKVFDIRQFVCNGDLVALLAGSQVMLIELTRFGTVARWPVWAGPCSLLAWEAGFVALGAELAMWSEGKSRGYGVLESEGNAMLENRTIKALVKVGDTGLGLTTSGSEMMLLHLGENSWSIWFTQQFTSSVFSLHPTSESSTMVAVMDSSSEQSKAIILQRVLSGSTWQETGLSLGAVTQIFELSAQCIVCVGGGHSWLLRWVDEQYKVLEQWPEEVLAANSSFVITTSSIYSWECFPLSSSVITKDTVLLGCVNGDIAYYLNGQGQIKALGGDWQGEKIISEGQQSYFICYLGEKFITASSNDFSKLTIYQNNEKHTLPLIEQTMIRSLSQIRVLVDNSEVDCLVAGHLSGKVFVYHSEGSVIVSFSHLPPHPIRMTTIDPSQICVSAGKSQYILNSSEKNPSLTPISVATQGISSMVYLSTAQTLLYQQQQNQNLIMCRINEHKLPHSHSHRQITLHSSAEPPCVKVLGEILLIADVGRVRVLELRSRRELTCHQNYLKEVTGIELIELGVLVYGTDELERNTVYVYSTKDWQPLGCIHLVLKDKYMRGLKATKGNYVAIRGQRYTSLYHFTSSQECNLITEIKTDLMGYQLSAEGQWVLQVDQNRLIVLYHANQERIIPVARYLAKRQVTEAVVGQGWVVFGQVSGIIGVLEFNLVHSAVLLRTELTLVGEIDTGQQITYLSKEEERVWWGTEGGTMGSVCLIDQQLYARRREQEEQVTYLNKDRVSFSYPEWRKRIAGRDKIIDCSLIRTKPAGRMEQEVV